MVSAMGTNARIREALGRGQMTASELRVCLGLTRSQVTSALDYMRKRGVVLRESDGITATYSLGLISGGGEGDSRVIHMVYQRTKVPVYFKGNPVARIAA